MTRSLPFVRCSLAHVRRRHRAMRIHAAAPSRVESHARRRESEDDVVTGGRRRRLSNLQGVNGAWSPTPVGRTTRTSYTMDGLANGTTYSFTVAAYTKGGDGPLSLAVSAMPLSPPLEVKTTVGDRRVTLSWQPSAGATSYTIYRKVGSEPDFRELTTGSDGAAVRRSESDQRHPLILSASCRDRRRGKRAVGTGVGCSGCARGRGFLAIAHFLTCRSSICRRTTPP